MALLLKLLPGGHTPRTEDFGSYAVDVCVTLFSKVIAALSPSALTLTRNPHP